MKNLTKILSVFIAITGIIIVIALFNLDSFQNEFIGKLVSISIISIVPFTSIAICSYCMEKDDTNYLVRAIPAYLMIPIGLSAITILFDIKDGFIIDLYNFLSCSYLEIISLSLILVVKPNNIISSFTRYLASGIFVLQLIFRYILFFANNSFDISEFYLSLVTNSETIKIYAILIVSQIFTLLTLYISNYAFSDKIEIEVNDIDYDTVKQEASSLANAQMNSIYNISQKNNEPDRSLSEKGMMNINNQLGQNSNVGTATSQAKEVNISGSSLDSLMPLSKGPVVNSTVNEAPKQVIEEAPKVEEKVEQTPTPNIDIQEQMRLNREQSNQNNISQ